MKIGGPKGPAGPFGAGPDPAPGAKPTAASSGPARPGDEARPVGTASFREVLGATGTQASPGVQGLVADLAAKVRRGELTAAAAAEKLIDDVMSTRASGLDPTLKQRLRHSLERMLADDPMLASKLARLDRESD